MPSQLTRSRSFILGIGVVSVVALFLSLGDPGKEERQQIMTSVSEAQENIHLLEEKLGQQELAYRQQVELLQQLTHKLEVSEDQSAKLKTKIDELEKTVIRMKQSAPAIKPNVTTQSKPVVKPSVKPVVKPTVKPAPVPAKPVAVKP